MTARYEALRAAFAWRIPSRFNLGVACASAHAPERLALIAEAADGAVRHVTFGDLDRLSNRLANVLAERGVARGDRVGVVVPQSLDTGIAHLAIWKLGAISLPLAALFGPDALGFRLADSGATHVVTTARDVGKLDEAAPTLPRIVTGPSMDALLARASDRRTPVDTASDDPAYLIYTSGTTGPPKGALHAHRSLFGHLPGFECYYEFADTPPEGRADLASLPAARLGALDRRDVIWTPADWAWIGGLMDVLVPAWYFGMPVVTAEHDFDPAWAIDLMARHRVTLSFLPPTALKMMRAAGIDRPSALALRAVFTGGEPLGAEMLAWGRASLGAVINEGYGQTECNLVVGNCASAWPARPGSMGRAIPGHDVQVQDDAGRRLRGEVGEICVRSPDPVMMLGYWGRPDATAEKHRAGWLLTGDLGVEDDDGYLWFTGRKDDLISSMGYRIGPGEIEESLLGHPAVATCAVVGIPDELRGQVPAAFIVLRPGVTPSEALTTELQQHVRTRLAAHEVPRRVEFVTDLPRTTTGKIMRRALRARVAEESKGQ